MTYVEEITSARAFTLVLRVPGIAMGAWGCWLAVGAGEPLAGAMLVLLAAIVLALSRILGVLRLRVDPEMLRARFGPWGLDIAGREIEEARPERYPWLSYGGWGLRWGRHRGRAGRACSVPFLRTGVVVDTRGGRRHYLTSRRPDELAAHLNRLAEEAQGD